ncbi:anion permease [Aliifodinibius sp. S!AR15-10]|uniref:SLC13 family permease n=1 Tax=Aliifodinibius sp. S!AR15-10 TaxID=2950437 RepID=UPI00285ABE04|nr:anion permease [Aliifodinibius sp. S!AR15-10]MDR8391616.1 anion permease [Aliifodinibius sp. S!AR15-10]
MQAYLTDVIIESKSDLVGTVLNEEELTSHLDLDVLRIFKPNRDSSAKRSDVKLEVGDILRIRGSADEINKLLQREDISLRPPKKWIDVDLEQSRDAAESMGISTQPLLFAVTYAASLSFVTPFGYQTNTLIYGADNYKFTDFTKIGLPLNILFWIIATVVIPYIWPF